MCCTCANKINNKKFAAYYSDSKKLNVVLHGWHSMSLTIHKTLVEEDAKPRTKLFRLYTENFFRWFTRKDSNKD